MANVPLAVSEPKNYIKSQLKELATKYIRMYNLHSIPVMNHDRFSRKKLPQVKLIKTHLRSTLNDKASLT